MPSVLCGQSAILPLPKKTSKDAKLTDTVIAPSLTVTKNSVKDSGMLVYKVNKSGKVQPRRVGISEDHRTLWVTTNKGNAVKGLLNTASSQLQSIDISHMDHVVVGQITKRFILAQTTDNTVDGLNFAGGIETAEELSMSLFYRDLRSKEGQNTLDKQRTFETLDLIVPNSGHYKDLLSALQDMLTMYRKVKARSDSTTHLLEYLWVDLGKDLKDTLSNTEWLDICERLYVPLKKSMLTSLFKEVGRQLPTQRLFGGGLPLWAASQLLDDVRFHYLDASGQKPLHLDPLARLWNEVWSTDPAPMLKSGQIADPKKRPDPSEQAQSISAVAFLSFLRTKQREFTLSIEDVQDRICILNGKIEKEPRLSRAKFFLYLFSDANDALNPSCGKVGSDDMTHPLSHYWISSSHDTYLSHGAKEPEYNEHMYLSALYRGVRCLELDVHDNGDEPVICREAPTTPTSRFLSVTKVLKILRQFLLSHPKCYPVILNIENHCSFENQQRLANELFKILGKSGLIVVPDDTASIDEADLLPSPQTMRGKVLIMGKRPKVIEEGAKVVNDDYDNENDEYTAYDLPAVQSRDTEDTDLDNGIVIGFDSGGPIKADKNHEGNLVEHSPGELLYLAKKDLEDAKIEAAKAELKAHSLGEEADLAERQADKLIDEAGLSKATILGLASQGRGDAIDTGDETLEACRADGEGVEVQEFFGDSVEAARATYTHAENRAIDAAQDATEFLQKLNESTTKLREAEKQLQASYAVERKQVAEYQRMAAHARAKREDADFANARLSKLLALLAECEEIANSAENVVTTAMTESKISEKRAAETEARAARAASKAKEDRQKADEETKKEEALEKEASLLHEDLNTAIDRLSVAKKAVNEASQTAARVNEQIKLIESSTQYQRERKEQAMGLAEEKKDNGLAGKVLVKHAAKIEEQRLMEIKVRKAEKEVSELEKKAIMLKSKFERTAHQWKTQSDVASKLRRQADKSASTAEELAEQAEEEREAANLRHTAREKATSNVSEKDAYRKSLQAQVDEAQRAAAELENIAQSAKIDAENLAPAKEDLPDHEKNVRLVERRKAQRDHHLAKYNQKKTRKEEAEARAEEAKRLFETSDNVFSQAMHNAATNEREAHFQKIADRKAIVALNRARLLRKQAEHALEDARFAQSNVTECQIIIKRATEYTEKMARITPIPTSLAKMTFLHSTKHRHWDKSFNLPNTHVHSFSIVVLDQMKDHDPHNTARLTEFTSEHICRTFPSWKGVNSKDKINSEPLFLWAMGCQLVSLNYGTFDEHVLKADGRFRRNGSCGYVLKPDHLTHDDPLRERQETWIIDIIAGSCLPSPESTKTKTVNPFVRIAIYGGDMEGKKSEHRTKIVMKNGVNPIWDENTCVKFTSKNPSLAMCVFTVWHKGEHGEEFIAGASIPVSSLREGIRSVALFDMNHTRQGRHSFASLLVNLNKSRK